MSFEEKNNSTMEINIFYRIDEKNSFGIKGTMNGNKKAVMIKIVGVSDSNIFEQSLSLTQFKAVNDLIRKFSQAIALKDGGQQSDVNRRQNEYIEEEFEEPDIF
ncbi:MAG: hypothetical protein ACTSRG_11485 [Candidatus Helarchaeota archaeon]